MGDQNLGVYDPNQVFFSIGAREVQGYSDEEFIRTERIDENEASVRVGAHGDFTFQINPNKAGLVFLRLKQLSPTNIYLQSLKEAKSVFPIAIRQKHSFTELVAGTQCMIAVAPRKTFGVEESDKEWQIVVGELIETDKA
jgi:hypothetical protein